MSDVTQGQDVTGTAPAEKPDVDELFGAKDVDDLFPANYKAPDPVNRNASPLHDFIFSSPLHAPSRVLDAFGYGFKQDWGAGTQSLSEADEYLRKAGIYNDYAKGQHNIIKAANEAVMRPAVSAIIAAKSVMGGLMHGAQEAVVKAGEEVGAPNLGRELAAVPEAFPTGFHQTTGVPRFSEMPETITQAKQLDVIGAGEQGYFGTRPVEAEAPAVAAHDAKIEGAAEPQGLPGHDAEAGPSPVTPQVPTASETAATEAAPDIHAVARTIAPETFNEFDALAQKKDTFRRWIDELREVRDENAVKSAPYADEIADLQSKLQDATPRLAKKYNERLQPLIAERDAYITEQTRGDSADMAKVRQQLMETDYRMRDLAPDVSKAYREAELKLPQAQPMPEAQEQPVEQEAKPNEQAPAAVAGEEASPARESAPETGGVVPVVAEAKIEAPKPEAPAQAVEAKALPIAHAPSIVADVAQKLKAAGRPAEEADAAAQVVAAYWETRAARFEGKRGTAAEMYARETPDIVAGKEKPSKAKKTRELELAQKGGLDLNQSKFNSVDDVQKSWTEKGVTGDIAENGDTVTVSRIVVPKDMRDQGIGTEAMQELISYADANGKRIALSPSADFGGTKSRLVKFYKGLGFEENKGRNKDFTTRETMIREPKPSDLFQTAYHGSPYDFDVFDTGKIGTGEGAQVYGHGLYFAENEKVARDYQKGVIDQKWFDETNARLSQLAKEMEPEKVPGSYDKFKSQKGRDLKAEYDRLMQERAEKKGNLYRVDIKPAPENFLQWDKPLRDQPKLLNAIEKVAPKPGWLARQIEGLKVIRHEIATNPDSTGAQAYSALSKLLGGDKAATDALRDAGVPGIRYLDQGSRTAKTMLTQQQIETRLGILRNDLANAEANGGGNPARMRDQIASLEGELAHFTNPTHNYVVFDPKDIEILDKNGKPVTRQEFELAQGVKGRIRVRDDARNTITLMKTADASTFIHETGHDWLERMLDDARDAEAPAALKSDAETVLKWLGADGPDSVKTRHHEKFARGFETYMMEGRAPSTALARVFAKFRDWLTTIYKTVSALKSPISDDIRAVFDRLLAEKPEKTVIAPERPVAGGLAEKHEALAEATPSHEGFKTAGEIRAERDSQALPNQVEHNNARLEGAREGTGEHAPGGQEPPGAANAPGTDRGTAEALSGSGALGEGGSETAHQGARARKESERLNKAPTPILKFLASQGGIKASDALISDLRQSLGAKNHYIPGFGQVIRTPKQLSAAASASGKLEAMSLDRAREAAIEQGLLPKEASIRDLIDAIENEVRGVGHVREVDAAEQAHAEHSFLEGLNDTIKQAGGSELSDAERARALELYNKEGIHDPASIIERLALEADDEEIATGAPERAPGITGWDEPAPGWDAPDERPNASGPRSATEGAQSGEPRGKPARTGGEAEKLNPLDANAPAPQTTTRLMDKAGNIRLENLNTTEDVKQVIRESAERNAGFLEARRNIVTDADALKLADAMGLDPASLNLRKIGEAWNKEQIFALEGLLIKASNDVREAMAAGDELAYAERVARFQMIQESVQGHASGVRAEAGRALQAYAALKKMAGRQEAHDLVDFLKVNTGKTLYQLRDEMQLGLALNTPSQTAKFITEVNQTRWQKTRAGILSYFINNLISGPVTHAGYSIGNTVTQLFKATVDTSVSAAVGAIRNAPPGERVYFGEVGAQLYGLVRGFRDGYSPAWSALKTGVPYMKGDVNGLIGQIEAAHRPQAIPGKVGYALETPSRAVTAIHTMHYSMNYEAEIARRGFRAAVKEGLDPGTDAFNTSLAKFTQSPPEAEMTAAHDEALKMVLMKSAQFGTAQYHLQKAVNSNILAKIVMPFMQVGANILHESFIERTPVGLMSQTVRDNLLGKNGPVARDSQAARIGIGIGISTAIIGLTAEGILTGGGPSDHKQLAIKEMTGWKPYSIKIGDFYLPYRKYLGGLGPLIAGSADMYEVGHALNEEGLTKAAASSLFGFAEVIADESWAKGLANFIDAARHWDRDGGRYLRNLGADFIPLSIGLQQVTNLSDPYRREVRGILDSARAHIPGLSQSLYPVRDIWGEPIESHTALGPTRVNNDPATKALLDAGYYPAKLERKIRGVELSDQQYDDFARVAGRMARMRVNALANTPGFSQMPKTIQAQKLADIIRDARESARSIVMMQSVHGDNDIVVKAAEAKKAKITGQPATVH